ncbi:MAG: hypothetical protein AB1758_31235, partial [Candidatus Eremiobacterota bacterium]
YTSSIQNWESIEPRDFASLGRIRGFTVGRSQTVLNVTLLGDTNLAGRQVLLTTESKDTRIVTPLDRDNLIRLTDLLDQAEKMIEAPPE